MAIMKPVLNTITTTNNTNGNNINNNGAISISPAFGHGWNNNPTHVFTPTNSPLNNNNWPIMPSGKSIELSASLLIALISFDEVVPETRFFLMKYINLIMTSIRFTVMAKSGNPYELEPDITDLFLKGFEMEGLVEIAINDLISKGYVERKIDKSMVSFTSTGIDLLQTFIQFDKL